MMFVVVFLSCFALIAMGLCVYLILQAKNTSQQNSSALSDDFRNQLVAMHKEMQDQSLKISGIVQQHQQSNTKFLQETHQDYRAALGHVNNQLGELGQATKSMMDIGKDISSLQDILRAPKLRGGVGELFLADLLSQILPRENYEIQYSFKNKVIVDAVIRLAEGLVPVDAKFPLENFKRIMAEENEEEKKSPQKAFAQDVKKHIDSISSKYILPEENTFDFAIMYIPAENIYYETIIKQDFQSESLANYAMKKKVVPVSPNSFYAYLQAIVRGLKGMRIEESAQKILQSLGQIEADLERIGGDFEKIGGHLSNAQSAYERTGRSFDKMKTKLAVLEGQQAQKKIESATLSS